MFRAVTNLATAVALLLALPPLGGASAQVVARVNGEPLDRAEVAYLAKVELGYADEAALSEQVFATALKKAITNHALYLKAKAEAPDLVRDAARPAALAVAREYYRPFLEEIARPVAEARMTLERVLEQVPEREDLVFLYQITMQDRGALEALRKEILAGKIAFEDAARKHSEGNTARAGGQVGGIKRTDVRYRPETLSLLFDRTPKGGITPVVEERLGPALFWVKDRKSADEVRRAEAETSRPQFVSADMVRYAWEAVEAYAADHGGEILVNEANAQEFVRDPGRVAFRLEGESYTARDVFSRSGGMNHSLKDITTIAENCYRDIILQRIYLREKGAIAEAANRQAAMIKNLVARQWLRRAGEDLTVSEAEVDRYIAERQDKYAFPDRVDLGVIYVKTEQRLQQVLERLKVEDFETVAKGWSQNKRLAGVGGRVGVVPVSAVKGDLSQIAPGTVLEPQFVDTGEEPGYYVFKVYRFLPAEPGTRANLSAEAVGGARSMVLARMRDERFAEVVSGAMKDVTVEIVAN